MNSQIAAILTMDGVATGAIYVLIALGFVLIFAVTRIIFVPFGDITAFTALTLADLEAKRLPGTASMIAVLAVRRGTDGGRSACCARARPTAFRARCSIIWCCRWSPAAVVWLTAGTLLPAPLRIALTLLLILPLAPLLDRIVFRPIADGSVLLLLIVSVALHFALVGMGLLFFGPEGVRTQSLDRLLDRDRRHAGVRRNAADRRLAPPSSASCSICSSISRSPARRCTPPP